MAISPYRQVEYASQHTQYDNLTSNNYSVNGDLNFPAHLTYSKGVSVQELPNALLQYQEGNDGTV